MRKIVHSLLLALLLLPLACTIPQSIKDSDKLSSKLQIKFESNAGDLVLECLEAYVKESRAHVQFRAQVARRGDTPESEIVAFIKRSNLAISAQASNAARKYREIRGDYKKSLRLRLKVSEYLDSKASSEDIVKELERK